MTLVEPRRLALDAPEHPPQDGVIEALRSPVEILPVQGMVGVNAWRCSKHFPVFRQPAFRPISSRALHCRAVVGDLESPGL